MHRTEHNAEGNTGFPMVRADKAELPYDGLLALLAERQSSSVSEATQQQLGSLAASGRSHEDAVRELGNPDAIGDIDGMPYVR